MLLRPLCTLVEGEYSCILENDVSKLKNEMLETDYRKTVAGTHESLPKLDG